MVSLNYEHINWIPLCPNDIFNMNKGENENTLWKVRLFWGSDLFC